jgi:phosphomannomutase
MGQYFPAFKAYDVRGRYPEELNAELCRAIGRAYADETGAKTVCLGRDIRLSGPELLDALAEGLMEAGVDVIDLGLAGTEMVYFATAFYGYDGGVMITASHNPPEYNGLKMVRHESRPISSDSGLNDIERRAHEQKWERTGAGTRTEKDVYQDFTDHLMRVAGQGLKPLKVLANPGNGAAGPALEYLAKQAPLQFEVMNGEPDGHFPNGVPNPILEESRADMEAKMQATPGAYDFGVAWDGDYDRCFFLDENGRFIEGYYIVGLLAQAVLAHDATQTIIYDPRLTWNTEEIVAKAGGKAVMSKSGHAFIKEKMREVDAAYGGEMSAHHYFRDHWYCDSGMIPLLLIAGLVGSSGRSLASLVDAMIEAYPCSGEVNSVVADADESLRRVEEAYASSCEVDRIDGLSVSYPEWRFNLRKSNTEPVIRLNVETRGDEALMRAKTEELLQMIRS